MGLSKNKRINSAGELNIAVAGKKQQQPKKPKKGLSRSFLFVSSGQGWVFLRFVLTSTCQTSALTPEIQSKENRCIPSHNSDPPPSRDDELSHCGNTTGARPPIPQLFEGLPFPVPPGPGSPQGQLLPGQLMLVLLYSRQQRASVHHLQALYLLHFIPYLLIYQPLQEI